MPFVLFDVDKEIERQCQDPEFKRIHEENEAEHTRIREAIRARNELKRTSKLCENQPTLFHNS